MKKCSACGLSKSLDDFHRLKTSKDGRGRRCKPCATAISCAWGRKNREQTNQRARERNAKNVDSRREKLRTYRDKHRIKNAAQNTRWYAANKDKKAAANKAHRAKNLEQARVNSRRNWNAWDTRNPGKALTRNRAWRAANREASNGHSQKWRLANNDRRKISKKAWALANRARVRLYGQERRAREKGASGTTTPAQLEARIAFYGDRCWVCHGPFEAVDHVIPLARGGSNWPANLRPICRSCNSSKCAKHPKAFLQQRAGVPYT